jgi:integrase
MIGRRKSPDGLPFNLYMFVGKRVVSFGYKPANKWIFRLRAPRARPEKVAAIRAEAIRRANELNGCATYVGNTAELIDRYFEWQEEMPLTDERRKAESTLEVNRYEAAFLKSFFGKMLPAEIKAMHIYEYLDIRAKNGAPAKANKEIGLLSAILEYGRRKGELETNPCVDIDYNPTRPSTRLVTPEEVEFAVKIARERGGQYLIQALCVQAAYLLNSRPDETRHLRRHAIKEKTDTDPGGIELVVGKRRRGRAQKTRAVNWSPKLRAVIDEALSLQRTSSLYIFGTVTGQPYTISGWSSTWRRLMTHCEKADPNFQRFTLKDMRPRATTARIERGDTNVVDAGGWASDRMPKGIYDRRRTRRVDATE